MRIVETNEALKAFVAELAQAPYLALDTEFLRDQVGPGFRRILLRIANKQVKSVSPSIGFCVGIELLRGNLKCGDGVLSERIPGTAG